jgi:ATP/maltotriose-dependent transcriptional regulator MalT
MQRLDLVGFDLVRGRLAQADEKLEALRGEAARLGMPMAERFALLLRAGTLVDLGRAEEALAAATELDAADPRAIGNPRLRCAAAAAMGGALVACGRLDEGEARLREAVAFGEAVRPVYDRVLASLLQLLARRGKAAEAIALAESVPSEIDVAETLLALAPGELHLARVEAYLAAGRHDEARRAAAAARRWVSERIERRYSEETWRECARANPVIAAILRHAGER